MIGLSGHCLNLRWSRSVKTILRPVLGCLLSCLLYTSNGSGSGEVFMRVPLEAGPWLRLKIAAETSAGDSTAQEAVLAVKV